MASHTIVNGRNALVGSYGIIAGELRVEVLRWSNVGSRGTLSVWGCLVMVGMRFTIVMAGANIFVSSWRSATWMLMVVM